MFFCCFEEVDFRCLKVRVCFLVYGILFVYFFVMLLSLYRVIFDSMDSMVIIYGNCRFYFCSMKMFVYCF